MRQIRLSPVNLGKCIGLSCIGSGHARLGLCRPYIVQHNKEERCWGKAIQIAFPRTLTYLGKYNPCAMRYLGMTSATPLPFHHQPKSQRRESCSDGGNSSKATSLGQLGVNVNIIHVSLDGQGFVSSIGVGWGREDQCCQFCIFVFGLFVCLFLFARDSVVCSNISNVSLRWIILTMVLHTHS